MEQKGNRMSITIRDMKPQDEGFVLELNRVNVEVLSPMDQEKLAYFVDKSDMFRIAEVDGQPAAFLIALREGLGDYWSENYKWFSNQYEKFLYIDRIVIGEGFRHDGLGRQLYQEVFQRAADCGVDTVTAEVDIIPYNDPSLKFHKAMGFCEVGQQVIRGGEIKVSLQVRE
jgi:predicted GNAT superfamily acetyltransferase